MLFKPTVAELLTKGENRYRLAVASAKRARQIFAGSNPLIHTEDTEPVSIAADEIMAEALKIYDEDQWEQKKKDYEMNLKIISNKNSVNKQMNKTSNKQ